MAINIEQYVPKFEKLLERFSEPDYEIENAVYLNTLLSSLAGNDDEELGKTLLSIPLLINWVSEVVVYWESNDITPSQSVGIFVINLASLLSKDEDKFVLLETNDIYVKLMNVLRVQSPACNPSLKLGYIKLLSSFLNHSNGITYIISRNYWENALKYCLTNQTLYITKEGHQFMYNLLEKTAFNAGFSNKIIKDIMSILQKNPFENGTVFPEIKEEQLKITITPTLQLISFILEQHFKSASFANKNHTVPLLFLNNNLKGILQQMILVIHDEDLIIELEKIMVMIYLLDLHIDCKERIYSMEQLIKHVANISELIKTHLSKRESTCILKLSYWIQYYWHFVTPYCPPPHNQENPLLFENQILIMQTLPLYTVKIISYRHLENQLIIDEFRDNFVTKIFKIMCECTIRMAYTFRFILMDDPNELDNAQLAVQYLLKSKSYFRRETSLICFQGLLYNLKDLAELAEKSVDTVVGVDINRYSNYVILIIDAIILFINDYDFTWRESFETLCVTSTCLDLLNNQYWSSQVLVRTLKLLNISIQRLMQPNLALLIENTTGTTIDNLGPILNSKLKDDLWEVRDSALEVLLTVAEYSQTKFPSFQKLVLSSQFLSLVTDMCTTDEEIYVRASAIKCLQKMIQVSAFWYPHLEEKRLPQKMMQIILNEPEGIVRCEAAALICDIYFHQSFEKELMSDIYKIMSHAVISDLHWEVKYKALTFWEHVVNNELKNQGMIDGSFPSVTFSTENKKIVTLTNAEIAKRLRKVLNNLSSCGCLGVFIMAIMEDYELEVSKRAVEVVQSLKSLLSKYDVRPETNDDKYTDATSPIFTAQEPILATPKFDNDVMEEILDSNDINLLDDMLNDCTSAKDITSIKDLSVVHPDVFLNFIKNDLDSLITERKKWLNNIESLSSLLDDMLKTYDYDNDVNRMDCY